MYKKILIGLFITITVYAFPTRLLGLSEFLEPILKILQRLIYCSLIFFLLKRDNLIRTTDWLCTPNKTVLKKLVPALVVLIVYILLNANKFLQDYQDNLLVLLVSIGATFFGAFSEELFFRGYIFTLLKKEGYSTYKGIILSSLLFAGMHVINVFRYSDVWSVINQIAFSFLIGILLCSLFALTKNILAVSLYHFVINIPSALAWVAQTKTETKVVPLASSFSENLISTLVFFVVLSPLIMVSFHYLKLIRKENV